MVGEERGVGHGDPVERDPVEADLEGALAVALGARGNAVAVYFRVAR